MGKSESSATGIKDMMTSTRQESPRLQGLASETVLRARISLAEHS